MTTEPTGAIDMHNYEPTGHLPECPRRISDTQFCICDRLRACEARVREESFTEGAIAGVTEMAAVRPARTLAEYREANKYLNGVSDERKRSVLLIADAYGKGLDAARDAVAALPNTWGDWVDQEQALAAIDALRATP